MRKSSDREAAPAPISPWVQWIQARGNWFWMFVVVLIVALIITFVLSISERTLAVVAGTCSSGLLLHLLRKLPREWRDWELHERIIGVLFAFILFGAAASNFIRALLLE